MVPEEGLFYAAGRDVTETRHATEEQAALRRVATLVARETAPDEVFAAVGREVGEVLGVEATHLGRYDADSTVVSVAQWGIADVLIGHASHSRATACPRGCCGPGDRHAWMATTRPPE